MPLLLVASHCVYTKSSSLFVLRRISGNRGNIRMKLLALVAVLWRRVSYSLERGQAWQ